MDESSRSSHARTAAGWLATGCDHWCGLDRGWRATTIGLALVAALSLSP